MTENKALLKLDETNSLIKPGIEGAQGFYNRVVSREKWHTPTADRLDIIFTTIVVAVTLDRDNAESLFDDMISHFTEPVTQNERQDVLKRIDASRGVNHD